jgi:hypothetical protein
MASSYPPVLYFASLGDSINQFRLNSSAISPVPLWNHTLAVVTTADANTNADVLNSFNSAGFTAVSTDIVPPALVLMGTAFESDTLTMLVRVAKFEDSAAGNVYKNATFPVYHFSRPASGMINPFPTPALIPRGTGVTEFQYNTSLQTVIQRVVQSMLLQEYVLINRVTFAPVEKGGQYINGYNCIAQELDCEGDNQDGKFNHRSVHLNRCVKCIVFYCVLCGLIAYGMLIFV